MPRSRSTKRKYRLVKGPNDVDQILHVDGMLYILEREVSSFTKDTPRQELRNVRTKLMKLCNPERQGITLAQRQKAGELRDEFHVKLCRFNIPRWWQLGGKTIDS